jgi:hypothetical protein
VMAAGVAPAGASTTETPPVDPETPIVGSGVGLGRGSSVGGSGADVPRLHAISTPKNAAHKAARRINVLILIIRVIPAPSGQDYWLEAARGHRT